jgi:peptidoglycan/LPS O-acetylase OafA/YrhL
VVIFHAFPSSLRGGFIGVDFFFVISGFLISTIVFSSLDRSSFSFGEFYARRVRRIFPALVLVLIFCFQAGWLLLNREEFLQLARHILGASAFVSNFVLLSEVGYFDTAASTKPLLHLWSLGIEEQFYAFLPATIWMLWSRKRLLVPVLAAITLASFVLNLSMFGRNPAADFYLPVTRFWELLAGTLLAYFSFSRHQPLFARAHALDAISICGAMISLAGFIFINEHDFPGWRAAVPVIGAVLLISAGPNAIVNRGILSRRIMVWIGLISFPLYLWHWPLLAFPRIIAGQLPAVQVRIAAVVLSFVLASITYILVERPIRFSVQKTAAVVGLAVLLVVAGALGISVVALDGVPTRSVVQLNTPTATGFGIDPKFVVQDCGIPADIAKVDFRNCQRDARGPSRYALLGDSKAAAAFGGFAQTSTDSGRWLLIGGAGGSDFPKGPVLPNLTDDEVTHPSGSVPSTAFEAVASNPSIKAVVLMNAVRNFFPLVKGTLLFDYGDEKARAAFVRGYSNTIKRLQRSGKDVVIISDIPTRPDARDCATRNTKFALLDAMISGIKFLGNSDCYLSLRTYEVRTKVYRDLLASIVANNPGATVFDTTPYMCDGDSGACLANKNGEPLYSYADHVSDYAASLIGKDLNAYLDDLDRRSDQRRSSLR